MNISSYTGPGIQSLRALCRPRHPARLIDPAWCRYYGSRELHGPRMQPAPAAWQRVSDKPPVNTFSSVKTSATTAGQTRAALANRHDWLGKDIMWNIAQALYRRDNRCPPGYPPALNQDGSGKRLIRYDSLPLSGQHLNEANKSFVTGEGAILPCGSRAHVTAHIVGAQEDKDFSAFTSAVYESDLSDAINEALSQWGAWKVVIDSARAKEVLGVADIQREIRLDPDVDLNETAPWDDGTSWHWKTDDAFDGLHDVILAEAPKYGIDPHKESFTRSEGLRLYHLRFREALIKGKTLPDAAKVYLSSAKADPD